MKRLFLFLFIPLCCIHVQAQFPYGTTGLLHMPTADMQRDKTVMAGASYLNRYATPSWVYNTYNYYLNVTLFPCLEIAYTCTLNKGMPGGYWPERTWGKFVNQDRQFSVRLRAVKEGQFWKYMPAVVLGANDILTRDWQGTEDREQGSGFGTPATKGNGTWNRFYLAATKHIDFKRAGELGVHLAYVYNRRKNYHLNGVAVGFDFHPSFHKPLRLMAEYDSRTVNLGMGYSLWKDHINFVAELNDFKHLSAGIYFKVHLK